MTGISKYHQSIWLGLPSIMRKYPQRPEDILIDETNWSSPKSDYGQAIGEEVIRFSNLFSSKDNMLKPHPELPSLPIYPIFESDFAVGQSGYALHAPATKDNIQKGYIYTRNMLPF